MQRRAQIGLNKGEPHHALKNAPRIGRQGEIRDRTTEGQHCRMAGLSLLAAIIIYWNTDQPGKAVPSENVKGWIVHPNFCRASRHSDGRTSSSQVNTGGQNTDWAA